MQINQNYILRPYQQIIYDEIPIRLSKAKGVIVQSPPRSGKSKIIDSTVQRIRRANKIALVLSHRDKIQKQLIEHCNGISIDANVDHLFIAQGACYVAMTQTLINRPNILSQLVVAGNKVVILTDEMHVGNFNKIMDILPDALRIGFSATPTWKHAKWMDKYYSSLIHGPQVLELMQWGNIVPVNYFEMVSDLEGLKRASTGEFTEASQDFVFDKAKLYDGLFDELAKFTFNKGAIFCASKKSADRLYQQFTEHAHEGWRPVVYYSGKKNYDLAQFTELEKANILITVRSLGTGWDYPPLDFLVLWCAMGSLNSFYQTVFRNRTPHPGKDFVTTLDFGGNNSRFGGNLTRQAATMDRDWNVLSQPPPVLPKEGQGVGSIKLCNACEYMLSALARSCANCGYIYPENEVLLKQGELVKIEQELSAQKAAIMGRSISTLSAQELANYATLNNKKPFAMRVAKSHAITNNQFIVDYGRAIGYKESWATRELRLLAEVLKGQPDYSIPFSDIIVR